MCDIFWECSLVYLVLPLNTCDDCLPLVKIVDNILVRYLDIDRHRPISNKYVGISIFVITYWVQSIGSQVESV
jgi:hypothetical protein